MAHSRMLILTVLFLLFGMVPVVGDEKKEPKQSIETDLDEILKSAFGPDCPELNSFANFRFREMGMVLSAGKIEFLKDGTDRVKITPCSVVLFPKEEGNPNRQEIKSVRARVGYLQFEHPMEAFGIEPDLVKILKNKIVGVELAFCQKVTLRFPPTPETKTGGATEPSLIPKVYPLAKLGHEPSLGKWIADTIPEVIQPGTWIDQRRLSYHAPTQILAVYHTKAVHDEVDAFLQQIEKALSNQDKKVVQKETKSKGVVPVSYNSAKEQPRTPKHLFHFIIRYEGDGVFDETVTKGLKSTCEGMRVKPTYTGMTLPSGWYLQHPPQYIPPTPSGEGVPENSTSQKP